MRIGSHVIKTLKFSLVLHTRENADVFITLDENIMYGIHNKRVNILYVSKCTWCKDWNTLI